VASSDKNFGNRRFRLGGTLRGDLLFYDDDKAIEIGSDWSHASDGRVVITLFAPSLQRWQYPHHGDPLTENVKAEILQEVSRLLMAKDEHLRVKIRW
jgi:hypothetical protein